MGASEQPAVYETQTAIDVRIPTRFGIELGATVVRPRSTERFPALVWYDPYRNAWSGNAPGIAHYFAARGYVFVCLHVRGTGNSEGVSPDEYLAEETEEGCDAIAWAAAQPWCTGRVGMLGSSYSGFTCLQVAALQPPALRAIAPAYFTDRRYTDDCHYKGGCLRGYYDILTYGLWMVAMNSLPPHPGAVGARWSPMWEERLSKGSPYLLEWISHPVEDAYWARGSVIGRYERIAAASLLIGGWNDGYVNPPLRTFAALRGPKKLIMGPWTHTYPDRSHCGPRIHIAHELLRWWDRWLKEIDNGVDREPAVTSFFREQEPPVRDRTELAGRWYAGEDLPGGERQVWHLGAGVLQEAPGPEEGIDRYPYRPASARHGGLWDAAVGYGLPGDQRLDEALALTYTSPPLTEGFLLFGQPVVTLTVSCDVPVLPLACRVCEVAPDGTSVLVARGILNLTRRHGMDRPEPMPVETPTAIEFALEASAWRFTAGNRIRLAVDGSDFPNVWPTPYAGHGAIHRGPALAATLQLPVAAQMAPIDEPFLPSPHPVPSLTGNPDAPAWRMAHDVLEDRYRLQLGSDSEFVVSHKDPAEAFARAKSVVTASWPGVQVRSEAKATLVSDAHCFHLSITLNVALNDAPCHTQTWNRSVPRELL